MTDELSIDMKTPWCAPCKGYTDYKTRSGGEAGRIDHCDECGKEIRSASHSKSSILIAKIMFPILLVFMFGVPIYIGLDILISSIFISFGILITAIAYRVGFYKYTKHLRAFNDWSRRQALKKSDD